MPSKKPTKKTGDEKGIVKEITGILKEKRKINVDDPRDEIYNSILVHLRGPGVHDEMLVIDWNSLFDKNACPVCKEKMYLAEKRYKCNKCGFVITQKLFEKAKKNNENEIKVNEKSKEIYEKLKKQKLSEKKIREIYQKAMKRL